MIKPVFKSVDDYIQIFPEKIRNRLYRIRTLIRKAAPGAEEKISYGMPAVTLNGILAYYAAHSKHIGFYPLPTAIEAFREELSEYVTTKGTVHFPHDKPLPVKLITQITKFRVAENSLKAEIRSQKKARKNLKIPDNN
jgi:uncharacterized protein YdhG (YjbR/CyaY superfamily)